MKKTIIFFAVCAMLCGCKLGNKDAQNQPQTEVLPRVAVQTATKQVVDQDQVYSSTVLASAVNNIAPQSAGRIQTIETEVGKFVSKGQVLATMDNLQLEQTRIKYANDKIEYDRLKALLDEGGVSQSDFDQVEMALKVQATTLDNIEKNTNLRSPISGVVTARNYDQGDMYVMGQPLFTVQQIVPVKLLVPVSETDYSKVKPGQTVSVQADALPGKSFSGKIVRIHPTMDASTHTFNAEVQVQNSSRELRPGMYTRVLLNLGSTENIVIPDAAVVKQQGSGQRFAFVLDQDNFAQQKEVTLGRHFDGKYEVVSGLSEGETVVVKGAATLKPGQKVEILNGEK